MGAAWTGGRAGGQPRALTISNWSADARFAGSTVKEHLRKWRKPGDHLSGCRRLGVPCVVMRSSARRGASFK